MLVLLFLFIQKYQDALKISIANKGLHLLLDIAASLELDVVVRVFLYCLSLLICTGVAADGIVMGTGSCRLQSSTCLSRFS